MRIFFIRIFEAQIPKNEEYLMNDAKAQFSIEKKVYSKI
jgi:hypothetical protein